MLNDVARTLVIGETAFGHLRQNGLPAYPRNYELWYTYSAGTNRPLNLVIDELLKTLGRLSDSDALQISTAFFASSHLGNRLEELGIAAERELAEIGQIMKSTRTTTADYGSTLESASVELSSTTDRSALQRMVTILAHATAAAGRQIRELDDRLVASQTELDSLRTSLQTVRHESSLDPVTGLKSRRHFDEALEREIKNTGAYPLSLLLIDIDHFKHFNDAFGHQTGDQILKLVAAMLTKNIRAQDVACRYGGDELAVILPGAALSTAGDVAGKLRRAMVEKELIKRSSGQKLGRVTLSIGVAARRPGDTAQSLIERADSCLYSAKNSGRDRVVVEAELAAA